MVITAGITPRHKEGEFMPKKKALRLDLQNSEGMNIASQRDIYSRLCQIAVNTISWKNLPPEIDQRFLELALFGTGSAVFYWEEVVERFVCLTVMYGGPLDIYRIPKYRTAYAANGYHYKLTDKNSVILWNNYSRTSDFPTLELMSFRLANALRTMDVNLNAQKTPILLRTSQNKLLSMKNLYAQYEGNAPIIYGSKDLDPEEIGVINTTAPFIADKAFDMYQRFWEDAMNFLGIETANRVKHERLLTDEIMANLGYARAQRYVRINARKRACEEINRMFGLNIDVEFRQEMSQMVYQSSKSEPLEERVDYIGEIYG